MQFREYDRDFENEDFLQRDSRAIIIQESEKEKAEAQALSDFIVSLNLPQESNDNLIKAIIRYKDEVAKTVYSQSFELGCNLTKLNITDTTETIHDILHLSEQNQRAITRNIKFLLDRQQKEQAKALKVLRSEQ